MIQWVSGFVPFLYWIDIFVDGPLHLYKRVCPSVRPFVFYHFSKIAENHWNSQKRRGKYCGCTLIQYGRIYLPARAFYNNHVKSPLFVDQISFQPSLLLSAKTAGIGRDTIRLCSDFPGGRARNSIVCCLCAFLSASVSRSLCPFRSLSLSLSLSLSFFLSFLLVFCFLATWWLRDDDKKVFASEPRAIETLETMSFSHLDSDKLNCAKGLSAGERQS